MKTKPKEITKDEKNYRDYIVSKIILLPFNEAIQVYAENFLYLQDVCFLFSHPDGFNVSQVTGINNYEDIDVINFFGKNNLYFLDFKNYIRILQETSDKDIITTSISFDTQIHSYLYRKYNGQIGQIPENIENIVKLIKKRKGLVDSLPYTMENVLFNTSFAKSEIYKKNIQAVETYFYSRQIKAKNHANKLIKQTVKMFNSDYVYHLRRQYKLFYLALLIMTDLQLNHSNLSVYDKEFAFVHFFHNDIGIMLDRESNLAKLFFLYGTKIKFFGKIQKGRKDIVSNLKNMAWDLFHIHKVINFFSENVPERADYTLPFFVTYDKRLQDISDIYKIKNIAFIKNSFYTQINYWTDITDPIIHREFFTAQAYLERRKKVELLTEKELLEKIQLKINDYESLLN